MSWIYGGVEKESVNVLERKYYILENDFHSLKLDFSAFQWWSFSVIALVPIICIFTRPDISLLVYTLSLAGTLYFSNIEIMSEMLDDIPPTLEDDQNIDCEKIE